jgi:hypothetical protein
LCRTSECTSADGGASGSAPLRPGRLALSSARLCLIKSVLFSKLIRRTNVDSQRTRRRSLLTINWPESCRSDVTVAGQRKGLRLNRSERLRSRPFGPAWGRSCPMLSRKRGRSFPTPDLSARLALPRQP